MFWWIYCIYCCYFFITRILIRCIWMLLLYIIIKTNHHVFSVMEKKITSDIPMAYVETYCRTMVDLRVAFFPNIFTVEGRNLCKQHPTQQAHNLWWLTRPILQVMSHNVFPCGSHWKSYNLNYQHYYPSFCCNLVSLGWLPPSSMCSILQLTYWKWKRVQIG